MTGDRAALSPRLGAFARRVGASEYLVLWLSLAYFGAMAPSTPGFATSENLANLLSAMLPLLAVAVGQTIVLVAGGIDLSVTGIISLASITGGLVMTSPGPGVAGSALAAPAGVIAMLLIGAGVGFLNGAAVTRLRMPPFIVTLTSMMFVGGLALWLTQSRKVAGLPPGFTVIGRELWLSALVVVALAAVAHVLLSRSLGGRWLYAVGHNPTAAFIAGVPVNRVLLLTYMASGVCAAIGSVLYTGRLETADPDLGRRILLDVIAATVIGGTSLYGGKGKVLWTVFGVLFLVLLDNSLNLRGLSHFTIMMVKGAVILLAALVDTLRNR